MSTDVIELLREALRRESDEATRQSSQRFFKEGVKVYGVRTATVTRIGKECFALIEQREKGEIFTLCQRLWMSGYLEESFIACNWSYNMRQDYDPEDFVVFEGWLSSYVSNWASCDTLCNHTIGAFVETYPRYLSNLREWTQSDNRWVRRGAAVTLIIPARKGKFLDEIFGIADDLLLDQDDLVQKGYGWMLKVASQTHQRQVFDYVMRHKAEMPRTALRYAIEKMPQELRARAMER